LIFAEVVLQAVERAKLEPGQFTPASLGKLSLKPRIKSRVRERLAKNFFRRFMESAGVWSRAPRTMWRRKTHSHLPYLRETFLPIQEQNVLLDRARRLSVPGQTAPNVVLKKKRGIASVRLYLEFTLKCGLKPDAILAIRYEDISEAGVKIPTGDVIPFGEDYHQVARHILDEYLSLFGPWQRHYFLFYRRKPAIPMEPCHSFSLRQSFSRLFARADVDADVLHRSHFFRDFLSASSDREFAEHLHGWHRCSQPKIQRYGKFFKRAYRTAFRVPDNLPFLVPRLFGFMPPDSIQWSRGRKRVTVTYNEGEVAYVSYSSHAHDLFRQRGYQVVKLLYALCAQREFFGWRMMRRGAPLDFREILRMAYWSGWKEYKEDLQNLLGAARNTHVKLRSQPAAVPLIQTSTGHFGPKRKALARWLFRIPILDSSSRKSIWLPSAVLRVSARDNPHAFLVYPWLVARFSSEPGAEATIDIQEITTDLFGSKSPAGTAENPISAITRLPRNFFKTLEVQGSRVAFSLASPSI
jgi:hypothetical protein